MEENQKRKEYETRNLQPAGEPGLDPNNNAQLRLSVETWKHAALTNKEKWTQWEETAKLSMKEVDLYKVIESKLHPDKKIEESLQALAELFVTKYPKEDHEVVKNLVSLFVRPVERALEEKKNDGSDA